MKHAPSCRSRRDQFFDAFSLDSCQIGTPFGGQAKFTSMHLPAKYQQYPWGPSLTIDMKLLQAIEGYSSRPDAGALVLITVFESISLGALFGPTPSNMHAANASQLMSLLATAMWSYEVLLTLIPPSDGRVLTLLPRVGLAQVWVQKTDQSTWPIPNNKKPPFAREPVPGSQF